MPKDILKTDGKIHQIKESHGDSGMPYVQWRVAIGYDCVAIINYKNTSNMAVSKYNSGEFEGVMFLRWPWQPAVYLGNQYYIV